MLKTRQADMTCNQFPESALREMCEHSFQAVSLSRILDNTGLTKGALYHHFPNKLALGFQSESAMRVCKAGLHDDLQRLNAK